MEKPTVYIESTVVSYYTAKRTRDIIAAAHQEITIEWWEKSLPNLEPFISQIVIQEIERGDQTAASLRLQAVESFDILELNQNCVDLANKYFDALKIPDKARADTLHMALAVIHGIDYMVSWNCTHIAAGRVISAIEVINEDHGFASPIICTPEELMEV